MIILTPNRRLTAFSLQQFNEQQLAANKLSWITPQIFPLETWLHEIWNLCLDNNLASYRPLLTPKQQQLLFTQIIQKADIEHQLLRVSATAQNAIQAWKFLKQYQVDLHELAAYADFTADTAAFHTWLQAYLLWLDQYNYYDFVQMVDVLNNLIPEIIDLLPKQICLRGFNELTPQYHKLFASFAEHGIQISHDQLTTPGAQMFKTGFMTDKQELIAAATWSLQQLEQHKNQTIGIVIPNLEELRDHIHNHIAPLFAPGLLNVSAPLPLANYALIYSALQILNLATAEINYADFSALLRSPYIAGYFAERNQRAQLDRMLRDRVEAKVRWQRIFDLIPEEYSMLKQAIQNFVTQISNLNGKDLAQYWVIEIQALLQCWGWPGDLLCTDDAMQAQEHDLMSCWSSLLEEYCQLSIILPKHSFSDSVQIVRRLANEIPFAPAETGLTKVHILGLLEAEGLVFDHMWVCGMTRDNWPPAAKPNPFIPIEIQRKYNLPHSTADRELLMAKKYTANLQQGGKETVVFSFAQILDDYPTQISNLLADLPHKTFTLANANPKELAVLEHWTDNQTTPYVGSYVSGGAASLRMQAQCPFKANAELRLLAKPLAEPQTILTPLHRGSIVHAVLEEFWRKCKSHAQLIKYTADELAQHLRTIIQNVLHEWSRKLPFTLTNSYQILEGQRLFRLISRWLEYEAERSPFVVVQMEEKTLVNIGPLQINMIIDRIDQVGDQYVIIDYKTGDVTVNDWFTDPIYEPQLPIYACAISREIHAVAFAVLRSQDLRFKGLAVDEGILPQVNVQQDWSQLLQDWSSKLQQTAQNFLEGHAAVSPYSPMTCNLCQLHSICRIHEKLI